MKKLLYTIGLIAFSYAANAQSHTAPTMLAKGDTSTPKSVTLPAAIPTFDTSKHANSVMVIDELHPSKQAKTTPGMENVLYGKASNGQLVQFNVGPSYGGMQDGLYPALVKNGHIYAQVDTNFIDVKVNAKLDGPAPLAPQGASANLKEYMQNGGQIFISLPRDPNDADLTKQVGGVTVQRLQKNLLKSIKNQ